jgi:hypothetical protein
MIGIVIKKMGTVRADGSAVKQINANNENQLQ